MYFSYADCKFYMTAAGDGYQYDRFWAVYTIEEGITLLNTVSYSSCIHNGGFVKVQIDEVSGNVTTTLFSDGKASVLGTAINRPAFTIPPVFPGSSMLQVSPPSRLLASI